MTLSLVGSPNESLKHLTEKLEKRTKDAQEKIEKAAAIGSIQMFLPGFDIGAMPNHLNRSSFIAPIAKKPCPNEIAPRARILSGY